MLTLNDKLPMENVALKRLRREGCVWRRVHKLTHFPHFLDNTLDSWAALI